MSQLTAVRNRRWYPVMAGVIIGVAWTAVMLSRDYGLVASAAVGLLPGLLVWTTEELERTRRLRGQRQEDMGVDYRA